MPEHDIPSPPVDLPDPEHGPEVPGVLVHPGRTLTSAQAAYLSEPVEITGRIGRVGGKVEVGVATWAGYGGAAASSLSPFVAYLAGLPLPESITGVLVAIGGVLTAITTIGRQLQAR